MTYLFFRLSFIIIQVHAMQYTFLTATGWGIHSARHLGGWGASFALESRKPINTAVLRVAVLDGQLPGKAGCSYRARGPVLSVHRTSAEVWRSVFALDLRPGVAVFNS